MQTTTVWKCYRCDLTFKQEPISAIHQDILHHPIKKIRIALVA